MALSGDIGRSGQHLLRRRDPSPRLPQGSADLPLSGCGRRSAPVAGSRAGGGQARKRSPAPSPPPCIPQGRASEAQQPRGLHPSPHHESAITQSAGFGGPGLSVAAELERGFLWLSSRLGLTPRSGCLHSGSPRPSPCRVVPHRWSRRWSCLRKAL